MDKDQHQAQQQEQQGGDPAARPASPGSFSGDSGTPAGGEMARGGDTIVHPGAAPAHLARPADPGQRVVRGPDEAGRDIKRTALDGAPGIPAGGERDLEEVLKTPDSDLGGVVAGDTTPAGDTEDRPSAEQVRREDRERNTL